MKASPAVAGWARALVAIAAVAGLGAFWLARHRGELRLLLEVAPLPVAGLVVAKLVLILLLGWHLKVITAAYGARLDFKEWFGLSRATTFAGLFLPFPGAASLRAVYLKRRHGMRYGSFIAAMSVSGLIKLVIVGGATLLLLAPLAPWTPSLQLLAGVAALVAGGPALFLLFGHRTPTGRLDPAGRLARLAGEWRQFRADRVTLLRIVATHAAGLALGSVAIWFSLHAFGASAGVGASGVITAALTVLGTVKLIPGDLVAREFVFAGVAAALGVGLSESLHAAALYRLVDTLCTLALAPGSLIGIGHRTGGPDPRPDPAGGG